MKRKTKNEVTPAMEPLAAPAGKVETAAPNTRKPRSAAATSKARATKAAPAPEVPVVAPAPVPEAARVVETAPLNGASSCLETPSTSIINLHDEIARQAYLYWVDRGRVNGSPVEDWLRAEREVRRRLQSR